jgi:hypothetical protein
MNPNEQPAPSEIVSETPAEKKPDNDAAKFLVLAASLASCALPSHGYRMIQELLGAMQEKTPPDLYKSPVEDLLGVSPEQISDSVPLARAAAAIAALRVSVNAVTEIAEGIKKATKTDMEAKMTKALRDAAKHREKLTEERLIAENLLAAKDAELKALHEEIEKEAPLLSALATHVSQPRKGCVCVACRMHDKIRSMQDNLDDLKKKNAELKETLKGFQGPRSKKKK